MSVTLPTTCVTNILTYLDPYATEHYFDLLSKEYNKIGKQIKSKYVNAANKIQVWYTKYTTHLTFDDMERNLSKLNIIKIYRKRYAWKWLCSYPEFVTKKLNRPEINELYYKIPPFTVRTAYDVIKFLLSPEITKDDLYFVGI
jgi:hypothetical protein